MPGNILNADTGFPTFAEGEDSNAKIDKVMNYLYMLLEQLRYSLSNLDADNFNETGLKEIADGIARPLQTSFENEFGKTSALIEGWSNEYGSQIKLLTEWKGTASQSISSLTQKADANAASIRLLTEWKGTASESISSLTQKADANAASITLLTEWKGDMSASLAAVQTKAGQNEAQITSLVQWKNTADDDIDGLSETMAVIEATAGENGAQINQIVSAIGKNGEVTFASIAAGVSDDESFIELIADKVALKGFVTFESLENDGEGAATVNGNNLALIANASCDAISQLNFKKWRYTDYDYNTEDNQLENMAAIKAIDDERSALDDSRYAILIQTYDVHFNNTPYDIALKLIAQGAFSVETNYSAYIAAAEYCTIDALWNTRIRADRDFEDARSAASVASNDYSFNTDGIYYGGKRIVDNSKEV